MACVSPFLLNVDRLQYLKTHKKSSWHLLRISVAIKYPHPGQNFWYKKMSQAYLENFLPQTSNQPVLQGVLIPLVGNTI